VKTMTATEASRCFLDLLNAAERGETITIVRNGHPVAQIGPARRTGAGRGIQPAHRRGGRAAAVGDQ